MHHTLAQFAAGEPRCIAGSDASGSFGAAFARADGSDFGDSR